MIVGLGESEDDRIALLPTLATRPGPDSVPINTLVAVEGTPMGDRPRVAVWDMVRTIAMARVVMPGAMVRLSARRVDMSESDQALRLLAGANSVSAGEKLLRTPKDQSDRDAARVERPGTRPKASVGP